MQLTSRIHRQRPRQSQRQGAAAVEMAIAFPVLVAISFGVFDLGRAFMTQHLIQDAARQGCRAAIVPRSTTAQVREKITNLLAAHQIKSSDVQILVNGVVTDISKAAATDNITVKISVPMSDISLIAAGSPLMGRLSAVSTLRRE